MSYEERFENIQELGRSLIRNKEKLVACAVRDLRFTVKDSAKEVDVTFDRLKMYEQAAAFLKGRRPLGGTGSRVSLMLSYNGSSWLNTAITSIYIVGNKVSGKKLVCEGPGQDPFIVFPDADLDLALSDLMTAKFMYSGQTCTAPKRIFIHRSIYENFLQRFVERLGQLVVGDPADEAVDIAPVVSDLAVQRIRRQLEDACAGGARILAGGKIEGSLIHPTVVKDATDDMLGMKEEVFGPVAFTTSFETEEEAIRRAKSHKYGLRAAGFGGGAAKRTAGGLKGGDYCHSAE